MYLGRRASLAPEYLRQSTVSSRRYFSRFVLTILLFFSSKRTINIHVFRWDLLSNPATAGISWLDLLDTIEFVLTNHRTDRSGESLAMDRSCRAELWKAEIVESTVGTWEGLNRGIAPGVIT